METVGKVQETGKNTLHLLTTSKTSASTFYCPVWRRSDFKLWFSLKFCNLLYFSGSIAAAGATPPVVGLKFLTYRVNKILYTFTQRPNMSTRTCGGSRVL